MTLRPGTENYGPAVLTRQNLNFQLTQGRDRYGKVYLHHRRGGIRPGERNSGGLSGTATEARGLKVASRSSTPT